MRKLFLICILSLLFMGRVFSQSSFEIGVTGGTEFNFASSFNKDVVKQYEAIPGFHIGLRMRHNFGIGSFIWGFEYAQLRFIFHNEPIPNPFYYYNYQEKMSLVADQLRIPLLFQINVGQKKSQFFVNGGPCVLFSASRYPDKRDVTFGDDESTFYYPDEIINEINIGFVTGMGYSYKPTSWLRIFADTRFILPLFANNGYGGVTNNHVRTLGLGWSLGVSFRASPK